jgi:hypothetical protein
MGTSIIACAGAAQALVSAAPGLRTPEAGGEFRWEIDLSRKHAPLLACARLIIPALKRQTIMSRDREGVHHGPKGQSELKLAWTAEAYPTRTPDFPAWGMLQLAQPGDSPA